MRAITYTSARNNLAAKATLKQPALTGMEKQDANPRKSTLKKNADAMEIIMEQLME
ncbi:MAG: hypothetical protein GY857_10310 [Desulfobacula sp.]|nr:hypothetical protein [Desulfobacula sp.]